MIGHLYPLLFQGPLVIWNTSQYRILVRADRLTVQVPEDCSRQVAVPVRCEVVLVPFQARGMEMCGGLIPAIDRTAPPPDTYYTSLQYPLEFTDELGVPMMVPHSGNLYGIPIDELGVSLSFPDPGTLEVTISYASYTGVTEELDVAVPTFSEGTLVATIVYQTYTTTDEMDVPAPSFPEGTLEVTIAYINYSNWIAEPLDVAHPTFSEGTLT